jgi:uncharacterized membrane protein
MDQQPQYGQQYQQPPQSSSPWGASTLMSGLGADVLSGLAYLIGVVPFIGFILQIVLFAVEKNRFAKFHAAQAMLISIVGIVIGVVWSIINFVLTAGASVTNSSGAALGALGGATIFFCIFGILFVVLFAFWIWGMISGFTGKATKLPLIGNFAEGLAGGPVQ